VSLVPKVLFQQFRFFMNLFFLTLCLTQFVPALKVGFMFTYLAPLVTVLAFSLLKEAFEDFLRFRRDREANLAEYTWVRPSGQR
jgi:phospholipid-translocating ATPase